MTDIKERIMTHVKVYEAASLEVPPYRITRPECKELHKLMMNYFPHIKDQHYDEIDAYMGVKLEIVTKG